jgi:hypothetical protein
MAYLRPSVKHLQILSNVFKTTDWVAKMVKPLPDPIADLPFFRDSEVNSFSMMVHSISFPAIQSNVQEVSISGFKIRVPVDTEFSNTVSITLHETTSARVIDALWKWQRAIEDPLYKKKEKSYKGTMIIFQHDPIANHGPENQLPKDEKAPVASRVQYHLYGVAIAGFTLPDFSGDKPGEIVRPVATFSYDWMEIKTEETNFTLTF